MSTISLENELMKGLSDMPVDKLKELLALAFKKKLQEYSMPELSELVDAVAKVYFAEKDVATKKKYFQAYVVAAKHYNDRSNMRAFKNKPTED